MCSYVDTNPTSGINKALCDLITSTNIGLSFVDDDYGGGTWSWSCDENGVTVTNPCLIGTEGGWPRITCSTDGSITSLDLDSMSLTGNDAIQY